mmetsp:Transcript_13432/g.48870  ORF Transcript_13432/g.48870 Transcript_13432/m.48870 type:complete len:314 (+) Transcript_13432:280-1221(+)
MFARRRRSGPREAYTEDSGDEESVDALDNGERSPRLRSPHSSGNFMRMFSGQSDATAPPDSPPSPPPPPPPEPSLFQRMFYPSAVAKQNEAYERLLAAQRQKSLMRQRQRARGLRYSRFGRGGPGRTRCCRTLFSATACQLYVALLLVFGVFYKATTFHRSRAGPDTSLLIQPKFYDNDGRPIPSVQEVQADFSNRNPEQKPINLIADALVVASNRQKVAETTGLRHFQQRQARPPPEKTSSETSRSPLEGSKVSTPVIRMQSTRRKERDNLSDMEMQQKLAAKKEMSSVLHSVESGKFEIMHPDIHPPKRAV